MSHAQLALAYKELHSELARGEDISSSPSLIYEAALSLCGRAVFEGEANAVDKLFSGLPKDADPKIVFELLRWLMMYSNDSGHGLKQLAANWLRDENHLKSYVAANEVHFVCP